MRSRADLGVCIWRRRPSSIASLVIATAWWIARASLALACRLAPSAPSRVSRVARRCDGGGSLRSRAIRRLPLGVCLWGRRSRFLRSSSRRRGELFARLSRSHVGSRLTRRLASLALLVVITVIFVAFSRRSRRVHLAPSSLFSCFARHRDGVVDCSRVSRAHVSARASCAVACLPRCSSSRRRLLATSHQCPSTVDPLRLLRSSSRRRGGSLARLSRSRVSSRLPRRRASLALLVVATAKTRCILASLAVASRRVPLAP